MVFGLKGIWPEDELYQVMFPILHGALRAADDEASAEDRVFVFLQRAGIGIERHDDHYLYRGHPITRGLINADFLIQCHLQVCSYTLTPTGLLETYNNRRTVRPLPESLDEEG